MDDRGNSRSESRAPIPGVFLLWIIFLNVFSPLGLISVSNHAYSQEPADGVSIETPVKVEPAKALPVEEIQSQKVQDPPVTIPSAESGQNQDPQDPATEEDPDEQLRKKVRSFFDSSERSIPESQRVIQKQNPAERVTAPLVETCPQNTKGPGTLLKPEQCTP